MSYESVATISQLVSLFLFLGIFLVVLVYALWPANGRRFDEVQRISLDLDDRRIKGGRS